MIFTSDILYILLDYCDPIDTNIITVIESFTDNEKVFDRFAKYSVQKNKRTKYDNNYIIDKINLNRKNQFKQFQKMKKENNYKSLSNYSELTIKYDTDNFNAFSNFNKSDDTYEKYTL